MNRDEYKSAFDVILSEMARTTQLKNSAYAGVDDPFKNFTLIEYLTSGQVSADVGILTRMSDKMQRICNLETQVMDTLVEESQEDNLLDLAVYSVILLIRKRIRRGYYDKLRAVNEAPKVDPRFSISDPRASQGMERKEFYEK